MNIRHQLGRVRREGRDALWRSAQRFGAEPDDTTFIHLAYMFLLDREPDPAGFENYASQLAVRQLTRREMLEQFRGSDEFWFNFAMAYDNAVFSIHRSRALFVMSFPRASHILDLGGTHQSDPAGALVRLGYPYPFERLVIVDLPPEERHELYREGGEVTHVDTELGPVEYSFHSMVDLSRFDDASFDLVYSGQTVEHVTPDVCDKVLAEVGRVLRPGGWFAVDTPNGRLCRMQLDGSGLTVTNPDHEVEYDHPEFSAKLGAAGFEIREAKGLVLMAQSIASGEFTMRDLSRHPGVFHEIDECYILAYLCQKPR